MIGLQHTGIKTFINGRSGSVLGFHHFHSYAQTMPKILTRPFDCLFNRLRSKDSAISTQQIIEEKEEYSHLSDNLNLRPQPEFVESPTNTTMAESSIRQQRSMPIDHWLGEMHFNVFLTKEFFAEQEETSSRVQASSYVSPPLSDGR